MTPDERRLVAEMLRDNNRAYCMMLHDAEFIYELSENRAGKQCLNDRDNARLLAICIKYRRVER